LSPILRYASVDRRRDMFKVDWQVQGRHPEWLEHSGSRTLAPERKYRCRGARVSHISSPEPHSSIRLRCTSAA